MALPETAAGPELSDDQRSPQSAVPVSASARVAEVEDRPHPSARSELYARRVRDALGARPVDAANISAVLRLTGGQADRARELDDAFASLSGLDGPGALVSAFNQAVADAVLPEASAAAFLWQLGVVGTPSDDPDAGFRTAIAPASVQAATRQPEVWVPGVRAFADHLADLIDDGAAAEAVEWLRQLNYDDRAGWLVQTAYENLSGSRLQEDLLADGGAAAVDFLALADSVHWDDAADLYQRLADATFDHHEDGPVAIPAGYPEHSSEMRAHLWVLWLRRWGVSARKVYALPKPGTRLVVRSGNALGATAASPRPVTWEYHVAPLIGVDPGDGGNPAELVLDPVLGLGRPVPIREWLEAMGVRDYDVSDLRDLAPAEDARSADVIGPAPAADRPQVWPAPPGALLGPDMNLIISPLARLDVGMRMGEDVLRDQSLQAARRAEFRAWHASLRPQARVVFDRYDNALDSYQEEEADRLRKEFHDWFHAHPERRMDFPQWFRKLPTLSTFGAVGGELAATAAEGDRGRKRAAGPMWAEEPAAKRARIERGSAQEAILAALTETTAARDGEPRRWQPAPGSQVPEHWLEDYASHVYWRERYPEHSIEAISLVRARYSRLLPLNSVRFHAREPGYLTNCVNAVVAVVEALSGRPFTPAPAFPGRNIALLEWHFGATLERMGGPDKIVERLLQEGPGSHGIAFYRRSETVAHVLNVIYDASLDAVVFFDGQSGRLASISPEKVYWFLPTTRRDAAGAATAGSVQEPDGDSSVPSIAAASDDGQEPAGGSGLYQQSFPGGYISARDVTDVVWRWLRRRLRLPGVFDLVLEARADGLYHPEASADDVRLDIIELTDRLPAWGAAEAGVFRLVVPGGGRFRDLMEGLSAHLRLPVLLTPADAGLTGVPTVSMGLHRLDISPSFPGGARVPWETIWPPQSWEREHGQPMVAGGFGGAFVVGLRAAGEGLMLFYNRHGGGLAVGRPEPGHLRTLGWTEGRSIVVVTERWPGHAVQARLQALSGALGVDIIYRFPQGVAGIGVGGSLNPAGRLSRLTSEPGLLDILMQRNDQGEPGFTIRTGRFVPLRTWIQQDLPGLPGDMLEVRLVIDDGEQLRGLAAEIASALGRPVWVTPTGAEVRLTDDGRVIAIDRQTGQPVAWVQITSSRVLNAAPPWYETRSGVFETRPGVAQVEFRRSGPYGLTVTGHWLYNRARERSATGFVSLTLYGMMAEATGELRAGVASPTVETMRARGEAFNRPRNADQLAMFLVDVPPHDDGGIGLVYPAEAGLQVRPASTDHVVELIRRGGYHGESQVIQFLTAPQTQEQYEAFVLAAQAVADALGRDVYIVGAAGATVAYNGGLGTFVATRGEQTVRWRLLLPAAASQRAELPRYFETNWVGALVQSGVAGRLATFANLVTLEPEAVVYGEHGHLDQYDAYEEQGGGELALVVVPTQDGLPVDAERTPLDAERAARAVANFAEVLRRADREVGTRASVTERPIRMLFRPLDDVEPDALENWTADFATETGTTVYMAEQIQFSDHFHDFTAGRWRMVDPRRWPGIEPPMRQYARNPVTGLLVPEGLAADPRAVFDPLPLALDGGADAGDVTRLISLSSELRAQADLEEPARPSGSLETEVFLQAFGDGSLGLHYGPSEEGETHQVSPRLIAVALAQVIAGRPVAIRWVAEPETEVDQIQVAATIVEVHVQMAVLTGGDPALAAQFARQPAADGDAARSDQAQDARQVVRRLRAALADNVANGRLPGYPPLQDQLDQQVRTEQSLRQQVIGVSQRLAEANVHQQVEARQEAARTARWTTRASAREAALSRRIEYIRQHPQDARSVLTPEEYQRWQDAQAGLGLARAAISRLRVNMAVTREAVLLAGDGIAGPYASVIAGAPLPEEWVADPQIPAGLWIRPSWPAEQVAAARAGLTALPRHPVISMIVVGMTGRRVPPQVWPNVRRALEQVPESARSVLAVRAIDTEPSAHHLADLVTVEEIITEDAPSFNASRRDDYDHRFRELVREVNDLIGRIPGTSREHQSMHRELAQTVGTFDEVLASPLTEEAVDLLGEIYAGLEAFGRRLEYRLAGSSM